MKLRDYQTMRLIGIGILSIGAIYLMDKSSIPTWSSPVSSSSDKQYVLLAANDLGMHCIQKDYSSFLLLPPANTVKAQVFEKGKNNNRLVTKGIKLNYEIVDNTTSVDKVNFWEYAKDYGFDVSPNVGITGNGLKGEMKLSEDKKYYEATALPVTPYNDGKKEMNPYQLMKITVTDEKTGKVLVVEDSIVVPVSNEMECQVCHGEVDTDLNILRAHDKYSSTQLVADLAAGKRYKCADCHKDNALGAPGKEGIKPLSEAMHQFHTDKVVDSPIQDPVCYSCHPGPEIQCYRGVMKAEGISCGEEGVCHGDIAQVARTQEEGREAWLQEPNCQECHEEKYRTNEGELYRNSYLQNAPDKDMSNKIQCESCHNGPHAEWPSELELDNRLPEKVQGEADPIEKCSTCHNNMPQQKMHQGAK